MLMSCVTTSPRPRTVNRGASRPSKLPSFPSSAAGPPRRPGTISLGQGVVSYGPPPEAIEAARRFGGTLTDHRYGPVEGLPELVEAIEAKLARENGIVVRPTSRVLVTAGGNLAFMNAVLAITDPGDEIILLGAVLLQPRDGRGDGRRTRSPCPTTSDYQLDLRRDRGRHHAAHARRRHRLAEQPDRRGLSRSRLRAVNALCRDRGIFHIHDEAYEYFTYGGVDALLAGRACRRGRPHDLALLAVEGLRHGELAHRLHGDSRTCSTRRSTRSRTRS